MDTFYNKGMASSQQNGGGPNHGYLVDCIPPEHVMARETRTPSSPHFSKSLKHPRAALCSSQGPPGQSLVSA